MDAVRLRTLLVVLALVATGACARGGDTVTFDRRSGSAARTTTTTAAPTTTTAAAPPTARVTVARAPAQPASPTCPAVPARTEPRADRTRYALSVDLRPGENAVLGTVTARFTPDLPTDLLVFRLWAAGPRPAAAGSRVDTGPVTVNGAPASSARDNPTTLTVRTGSGFPAGKPIEVSVPYRVTLPGSVDDRISRTGDSFRLGSFFPILAWEPGVGWAMEPPTSGFSEAAMTPHADFVTTVTVPAGDDVLATGVQDAQGRWIATAVPDFALSVGRFDIARGSSDGVAITVGVERGINESPAAYLNKLVQVMRVQNARLGPYPWPAYSLAVTPDLKGGIEFPMHVMQGPGLIGRTTSHELAHEWFYGLVHSNQGRDPWIDEGIASYVEARHERSEASFRSKAIPANAVGRLGEPMTYWESRQSSYYRGVYVQGAQALMALGPLDRVDCALRHVAARLAYRVATPAAVLDALSVVFPDARAVLARYGVRA